MADGPKVRKVGEVMSSPTVTALPAETRADVSARMESHHVGSVVVVELKPGRQLYANVEFYPGVVMDRCALPREMFTPTFASSRAIGWCANILEQAADNRIIRPSARYVGPPPPAPVPDP